MPAEHPLVAALTPEPLPSDGGSWLFVAGPEGPARSSELAVAAKGATLTARPSPERGLFTVKPHANATEVSVTVRWRDAGDSDAVRLHAGVRPGEARAPEVVQLEAPASRAPLPASARSHGGGERTSLFLLGGAAFASGANRGPLLGLGVTVPLPVWNERLAVEAEAGLRHAKLDGQQGATDVHSRVWGLPLLLSARVTLFHQGAFRLDGRAGGGVLAFRHHLSTEVPATGAVFPDVVDERRVGAMGFLAAQGAYDLGRWSVVTELRAALAPVNTESVRAELGGVSVSAGLRFVP